MNDKSEQADTAFEVWWKPFSKGEPLELREDPLMKRLIKAAYRGGYADACLANSDPAPEPTTAGRDSA